VYTRPWGRDGVGQRRGERAAARPGLEDHAPGDELEVGDHQADVSDVKHLRPVAEQEHLELRGRGEEVDEADAGPMAALARRRRY
jgi:hypothetical protein